MTGPKQPPDVELDWPASWGPALFAEAHRLVAAVAASGGAVGWTAVPDRAESDDWLAGLLQAVQAGRARLAVGRVGGRVEALGYWARLDGAVFQHNAELRKLMVHPQARGRGLARLLAAALVADAEDSGVETLVLDVRGNNHAAMELYESLGFVAYARLPDFVAVGAERFDRVGYRLDLRTRRGGRPELLRRGGRAVGPGAAPVSPPADG